MLHKRAQAAQPQEGDWGFSVDHQLINNIKGAQLPDPKLKFGAQTRPFQDFAKMEVKIAQPLKLQIH